MNMKLTKEQQAKVEENLGLVYKVLGDKLKGQISVGSYTREDLFQVGCICLCKAAATDKGGAFSTYAYRLIWHEICDVLVKANKQKNTEVLEEYEQSIPEPDDGERKAEINFDLVRELMSAKAKAPPHIVKGIDACDIIGQNLGTRMITGVLLILSGSDVYKMGVQA